LEHPFDSWTTVLTSASSMQLSPGVRLGPYEIVAPVYRARHAPRSRRGGKSSPDRIRESRAASPAIRARGQSDDVGHHNGSDFLVMNNSVKDERVAPITFVQNWTAGHTK
jgi:hypothetical protein